MSNQQPTTGPISQAVSALPPILANTIYAIKAKHAVPLELATICVLATANLVVAPNFKVNSHAYGAVPTNLFFLGLVDSGGRKSTVFKDAMSGVSDWLEHTWEKEANNDANRYEAEIELYKLEFKQWKKDSAAGCPVGDPPKPIRLPLDAQPILSKGTTNGIGDKLVHSPFLGMFTDEAVMFFGGHSFSDSNRSMEFVGLMTKLWDDGSVQKNTGVEHYSLRRRAATFLGLAQPGAFAEVVNNPKFEAQGFWPRVLLTRVPPYKLPTELIIILDKEYRFALAKFHDRCGKMLDLIRFEKFDHLHYFETQTGVIDFSDDGLEAYKVVFKQNTERANDYMSTPSIHPTAVRLTEHMIRLAATIAAFRNSRTIEASDVLAATLLTDYFFDERVNLSVESASSTAAIFEAIVRYIQDRQDTQNVDFRQLYTSGPLRKVDAYQRRKLVDEMVKSNLLSEKFDNNGDKHYVVS